MCIEYLKSQIKTYFLKLPNKTQFSSSSDKIFSPLINRHKSKNSENVKMYSEDSELTWGTR